MRLNKIIILGKGKEYNGRTRFKRIITNVLGKENTNNISRSNFCSYRHNIYVNMRKA